MAEANKRQDVADQGKVDKQDTGLNMDAGGMDFFTHVDNASLRTQWERFQKGQAVAGVRPEILESWQRCRKMGLSCETVRYEQLSEREFSGIMHKEAALLEVAVPILDSLFSRINLSGCTMHLATAEGISLRGWCYNEVGVGVHPGQRVCEELCGTAGLSLALPRGQTAVVYGAEHYSSCLHNLVCVSTPIIDSQGILQGGISFICQVQAFHPWSLLFMQEAASNIAANLHVREALIASEVLGESSTEATLVITRHGEVLYANREAINLLELGVPVCHAQVEHFLDTRSAGHIRNWSPVEKLEGMVTRRESSAPLNCVMSFQPGAQGGKLIVARAGRKASTGSLPGITPQYTFQDIKGNDPSLLDVIKAANIFAGADGPVLILGESGTGKELFAHAIHNQSGRHSGPFVVVNCGALPRELVQSELFGYASGAFTGARKQGNAGKFELAAEGTIFLDEIGEMDLEVQASLLRFLQSGEVARLGEGSPRRVNARVIAATNRDLEALMRAGKFREDLFHRLNTFGLTIPPLRTRRGDIPMLAQNILERLARRYYPRFKGYSFAPSALNKLAAHSWPGNVREMENVVERALFLAKSPVIDERDIPDFSLMNAERQEPDEKRLLDSLMRQYRGNVKEVARICQVSKSTLYSKLNVHGLNAKSYRHLAVRGKS